MSARVNIPEINQAIIGLSVLPGMRGDRVALPDKVKEKGGHMLIEDVGLAEYALAQIVRLPPSSHFSFR